MRVPSIRSFYTDRLGLVELSDDVLGIVATVRERYGERVTIELDENNGTFHFVEHCEDHTDRLIFSTVELDGRALERLYRADQQWHGHEDPLDALEREEDRLAVERDASDGEKLADAAERMLHALKKDGLGDRFPRQVAIPRDAGG